MDADRIYDILFDIKTAMQRISEFLVGVNENDFHNDLKSQSAVIHQLLLMGEATKRLPTEIYEKYDDIPWKLMARTRDILIHHYEVVDSNEIWQIAHHDLPNLSQQIERMLQDFNS